MNKQTLAYISCRKKLAVIGNTGSVRCGGELEVRDELTLCCTACGAESSVRDGRPIFVSPDAIDDSYANDERIQQYHALQYGPFLSGPDLQERKCFPQTNLTMRKSRGERIEGFDEIRQTRAPASNSLNTYWEMIAGLFRERDITEEFYQCVLEICRPYLHSGALTLDIGCALGRMTLESARAGAEYVIGIDLSHRMITEAARIASGDRRPIRLNSVADQTVPGWLELGWSVKNCDFLVADAQETPLKDNIIDTVLCLNVIDRVPDPIKIISEIERVTKPGGHVVIVDPYDWESRQTPRDKWTFDMATLFDKDKWNIVRELDGIPFAMNSVSRRVTVYMSHCIVYRKT